MLRRLLFSVVLVCSTVLANDINPQDVFDQTTTIVTENFYDKSFNHLDWQRLVHDARVRVSETTSEHELKTILNSLLDRLHASHTEFLSRLDQEYWALESIFSGEVNGAPIMNIGAWFQIINHKWFIRDVFEHSPAQRAGLLAGDQVLSVNNKPFEPVVSFLSPGPHLIKVMRPSTRAEKTFSVTSVFESFQSSMERASRASYKVFSCKKRVAYFHLWAGTNDVFKQDLEVAARKASHDADALILDLRDGFGGAYPEYLNPFFDHVEKGQRFKAIFDKPIVALTNEGVRSGKEWVAWVLKRRHRATLLGTKTRGYFLAGKPFEIVPNRYLLFLAVAKPTEIPDLENNGVTPDIEVLRPMPFAGAEDPQLRAALNLSCMK